MQPIFANEDANVYVEEVIEEIIDEELVEDDESLENEDLLESIQTSMHQLFRERKEGNGQLTKEPTTEDSRIQTTASDNSSYLEVSFTKESMESTYTFESVDSSQQNGGHNLTTNGVKADAETAAVQSEKIEYEEQVIEKWFGRNSEPKPEDLEEACRSLIGIVYKGEDVDPDSMIRRTPLLELYRYLHQHYMYKKEVKHEVLEESDAEPTTPQRSLHDLLQNRLIEASIDGPKGEVDENSPSALSASCDATRLGESESVLEEVVDETCIGEKEECVIKNEEESSEPGNNDGLSLVADAFEEETIQSHRSEYEEQVIEKWFGRNSEPKPEDLEEACRSLIGIVYKGEDVDPDSMIRRTPLLELYRYLHQHYMYKKEVKHEVLEESDAEPTTPQRSLHDLLQNRLVLADTMRSNSESEPTRNPKQSAMKQSASFSDQSEDGFTLLADPMSPTGSKISRLGASQGTFGDIFEESESSNVEYEETTIVDEGEESLKYEARDMLSPLARSPKKRLGGRIRGAPGIGLDMLECHMSGSSGISRLMDSEATLEEVIYETETEEVVVEESVHDDESEYEVHEEIIIEDETT